MPYWPASGIAEPRVNLSDFLGAYALLFSGRSLRAGLTASADIEERYGQKELGHRDGENVKVSAAARPLPRQSDNDIKRACRKRLSRLRLPSTAMSL